MHYTIGHSAYYFFIINKIIYNLYIFIINITYIKYILSNIILCKLIINTLYKNYATYKIQCKRLYVHI